jgi:hypothetical protein
MLPPNYNSQLAKRCPSATEMKLLPNFKHPSEYIITYKEAKKQQEMTNTRYRSTYSHTNYYEQ